MLLLRFDEGADESGGRSLRHDGATHEVGGNKSSILIFPLILSRDEKSVLKPRWNIMTLLLPPRIRMKLLMSSVMMVISSTRHHSPSAIICMKDMRENIQSRMILLTSIQMPMKLLIVSGMAQQLQMEEE